TQMAGRRGTSGGMMQLSRRATPTTGGTMSDLTIDPARTELVLIEYQNEFTSPGGVLHDAVAPVMESTRMLDNTVELVEKARAAGVTIMHAPITFAPGYGELTRHPYGILKGVVDSNRSEEHTSELQSRENLVC